MSKNATGISGFFSPTENPDELFEPEISLMHRNEDGPFELYKCEGRGRITVLKAIRREDRDNPLYNEMLRKEFEIGCSLNHPNIREYYSMREFTGLGMCVEMEWIDARTLISYSRVMQEHPCMPHLSRSTARNRITGATSILSE